MIKNSVRAFTHNDYLGKDYLIRIKRWTCMRDKIQELELKM